MFVFKKALLKMQKPPQQGGFAPGHRSDRGDIKINSKAFGLCGQMKFLITPGFLGGTALCLPKTPSDLERLLPQSK
jgi:hypothetical protein